MEGGQPRPGPGMLRVPCSRKLFDMRWNQIPSDLTLHVGGFTTTVNREIASLLSLTLHEMLSEEPEANEITVDFHVSRGAFEVTAWYLSTGMVADFDHGDTIDLLRTADFLRADELLDHLIQETVTKDPAELAMDILPYQIFQLIIAETSDHSHKCALWTDFSRTCSFRQEFRSDLQTIDLAAVNLPTLLRARDEMNKDFFRELDASGIVDKIRNAMTALLNATSEQDLAEKIHSVLA